MKRVLVVEDDRDLTEALADALRDFYEVEVALDGNEGLAVLARDPAFDVVVVDVIMPGLDGEGMIAAMRARGYRLPVIISSGTPQLAAVAVRTGAGCVLAKPYDLDALVECIEFVTGGDGGAPPRGDGDSTPKGEASNPTDRDHRVVESRSLNRALWYARTNAAISSLTPIRTVQLRPLTTHHEDREEGHSEPQLYLRRTHDSTSRWMHQIDSSARVT
jgi:DNA-binding response OmpR family regulator